MFYCPVCNYENPKVHGVRVHFNRRHSEVYGPWRSEWTDEFLSQQLPVNRRPRPKQGITKTHSKSQSGKTNVISAIREILSQAPNNQMTVKDIMSRLRAMKVVKSRQGDVLRAYISACVKRDPQAGVVKVSRGVYGLDGQTHTNQSVATALAKVEPSHAESVAAVDAGIPTYDELAGALERSDAANRKKMAVIEGLSRLIVIASSD